MNNALKFEEYGKIVWLWSNSEIHKKWPVYLQSRFILPAIVENQYYTLEEKGFPVAYCSWAFLDIEAEKKYILNPNSLSPSCWKSGDRLWFVDYISPFSTKYTRKLKSELAKIFPDHVGRSIKIWQNRDKAKILHFKGSNLSSDEYRTIRNQYFDDIQQIIQNDPSLKNRIRTRAI